MDWIGDDGWWLHQFYGLSYNQEIHLAVIEDHNNSSFPLQGWRFGWKKDSTSSLLNNQQLVQDKCRKIEFCIWPRGLEMKNRQVTKRATQCCDGAQHDGFFFLKIANLSLDLRRKTNWLFVLLKGGVKNLFIISAAEHGRKDQVQASWWYYQQMWRMILSIYCCC